MSGDLYRLFPQILGVAFFQFIQSLFEIFVWIIFLGSLFIPPPLYRWKFGVFCELDHLACFTVMVKWELCNFITCRMRWSNFDNTQQNSTKFAGGRWKNDQRKFLFKNSVQRPSKLKKRYSGSGAKSFLCYVYRYSLISLNIAHRSDDEWLAPVIIHDKERIRRCKVFFAKKLSEIITVEWNRVEKKNSVT